MQLSLFKPSHLGHFPLSSAARTHELALPILRRHALFEARLMLQLQDCPCGPALPVKIPSHLRFLGAWTPPHLRSSLGPALHLKAAVLWAFVMIDHVHQDHGRLVAVDSMANMHVGSIACSAYGRRSPVRRPSGPRLAPGTPVQQYTREEYAP